LVSIVFNPEKMTLEEKLEVCRYCNETLLNCICYDEVMLNEYLEQEQEIYDYLHR